MSSSIRGAGTIRRLFKRMPDTVSAEIVDVLDDGGSIIAAAMRARARKRTGEIREGIKYKVLPKSLRLRVGLLGHLAGRQAHLFYGFILDKGREAQTVTVSRFRKGAKRQLTRARIKTGPNLIVYRMKVRAMRADHFVSGRYPELRNLIRQKAKPVFERALARIGSGARD